MTERKQYEELERRQYDRAQRDLETALAQQARIRVEKSECERIDVLKKKTQYTTQAKLKARREAAAIFHRGEVGEILRYFRRKREGGRR